MSQVLFGCAEAGLRGGDIGKLSLSESRMLRQSLKTTGLQHLRA